MHDIILPVCNKFLSVVLYIKLSKSNLCCKKWCDILFCIKLYILVLIVCFPWYLFAKKILSCLSEDKETRLWTANRIIQACLSNFLWYVTSLIRVSSLSSIVSVTPNFQDFNTHFNMYLLNLYAFKLS